MFRKAKYIALSMLLVIPTGGMAFTKNHCDSANMCMLLSPTKEACCDINEPFCLCVYFPIPVHDYYLESTFDFNVETDSFLDFRVPGRNLLPTDEQITKNHSGFVSIEHPLILPLKTILPKLQTYLL